MEPETEVFERAGVYDPTSDDAADRLELLRYLVDHGLTIEEIVAAEGDVGSSSRPSIGWSRVVGND